MDRLGNVLASPEKVCWPFLQKKNKKSFRKTANTKCILLHLLLNFLLQPLKNLPFPRNPQLSTYLAGFHLPINVSPINVMNCQFWNRASFYWAIYEDYKSKLLIRQRKMHQYSDTL